MSLIESRRIAEKDENRKRFIVSLTSGLHNAEWIDPHLGVFIVPDISPGAYHERDHPHVEVECHP